MGISYCNQNEVFVSLWRMLAAERQDIAFEGFALLPVDRVSRVEEHDELGGSFWVGSIDSYTCSPDLLRP
jgi:hypothetical protein